MHNIHYHIWWGKRQAYNRAMVENLTVINCITRSTIQIWDFSMMRTWNEYLFWGQCHGIRIFTRTSHGMNLDTSIRGFTAWSVDDSSSVVMLKGKSWLYQWNYVIIRKYRRPGHLDLSRWSSTWQECTRIVCGWLDGQTCKWAKVSPTCSVRCTIRSMHNKQSADDPKTLVKTLETEEVLSAQQMQAFEPLACRQQLAKHLLVINLSQHLLQLPLS